VHRIVKVISWYRDLLIVQMVEEEGPSSNLEVTRQIKARGMSRI
jgi:hypothetical protein